MILRPRPMVLLGLVWVLIAATPTPGWAQTPGQVTLLRGRLSRTEQSLARWRGQLASLRRQLAQGLTALTTASQEARRAGQIFAADRRHLAQVQASLAQWEGRLRRDRRRLAAVQGDLGAVLRWQEMDAASPLSSFLSLFQATSLVDLMARASEWITLGRYAGRVVAQADLLVTATRWDTRRVAQEEAQALLLTRRAQAQAQLWAADRQRTAQLVRTVAGQAQRADLVVHLLSRRAQALNAALQQLVARLRTGHLPRGALQHLVVAVAQTYGLSPLLVWAVVMVESGGNPEATSPAGAEGLMQLMPGTAAGLGVTNPYNPAQNLTAGTRDLAQLLRHYRGNLSLALAAYTMGQGAVDRYHGALPPVGAVRQYVQRVLGELAALSHGG